LKILYIAPENVVGNLNLWKKLHEDRGNECKYITYFPSQFGFPDDICLNLPLVAPKPMFFKLREAIYKKTGGPQKTIELEGYPPVWTSSNIAVKWFFKFRDKLWRFWIEPAIKKYGLLDFDVYHLETGLGFYRNGSFVNRISDSGKPIFNIFHGVELRHRGVLPQIDKHVTLNLTSELDLIPKHPNLKYLYLPYNVECVAPNYNLHKPITVCHATRNRYFKGSDIIIDVCRELEKSHNIRFLLIENLPHSETIRLKEEADIYIDQINNVAPGYGMNSIEAMSLGTVCCTNMDEQYQEFMPDHPFVHVTPDTLVEELIKLIETPNNIIEKSKIARKWVEKHHSLKMVGNELYKYYRDSGLKNV
jgi:glycosyltransferase involved in cell wall biosynthesis